MRFPYKIIDSRIAVRSQFVLVEGCQETYALFYMKKGSFVIEINGVKEEIVAGDCVLLPDYVPFRRSVLNPIEFVFIKFTQNPSCPYSFPVPFGKICPVDKERFLSNIAAIERCIGNDDGVSAGYREHLLLDILYQIYYEQNPIGISLDRNEYGDRLVGEAVAYIVDHVSKKISIDEICRATGTNASTLNFKFRRELGVSIGQFITAEKINRAKRLLVGTTYSISDIAARCGFESVYYFSNCFKKHTGMMPSSYRAGAR